MPLRPGPALSSGDEIKESGQRRTRLHKQGLTQTPGELRDSSPRYLLVVVAHDTGRLVWAAPGRDKATLAGFFDALGADRCAQVRLVSADAAEWIGELARER